MAEDTNGRMPPALGDGDEPNINEDAANTNKRDGGPAAMLASAKRSKHDHEEEKDEEGKEESKEEDEGSDENAGSEEEEDSEEEESEEEDSSEEESEEESDDGEGEENQQPRSFEVNLGASDQAPARPPAAPAAPIEPTANDVLLHPRHGMDFRQFSGNMKLNFLIKLRRAEYLASDHATRATMIQDVVGLMRQLDPPGRFLKYRGESNWIEVSNEYAYMQVLQMFIRQQAEDNNPGQGGQQQAARDPNVGGGRGGSRYESVDTGGRASGGSRYESVDTGGRNSGSRYESVDTGDRGGGSRYESVDTGGNGDRKPPARDKENDEDEGGQNHPAATLASGNPEEASVLGDSPRKQIVEQMSELPDLVEDEDDGLVQTGYEGGLAVRRNLSAAAGSLNDEVFLETIVTQQERSQRTLAWTRQMPNMDDEDDGLFGLSYADGITARTNVRVAVGSTVEENEAIAFEARGQLKKYAVSPTVGVGGELLVQATKTNLRAAAASFNDDGDMTTVGWQHGLAGCCQQLPRPRRVPMPRSTTHVTVTCDQPVRAEPQSEPAKLVKPWHQPRRYRRPDPTTREDIRSEAAPPTFPALVNERPKCGSRSWEVSSAAARAILGLAPDTDVSTGPLKGGRLKPNPQRTVTTFDTNDVLTGRNERWLNHVGNLRYREAVRRSTDEFKAALSKDERDGIADRVMSYIEEKGGRFLRLQGEWRVLEVDTVRQLVLHSLRDRMRTEARKQNGGPSVNSAGARGIADATKEQPPPVRDATLAAPVTENRAFGCEYDYDEAVVEAAFYNYESFYGLRHGTATLEDLEKTSSGVQGWAAHILDEGSKQSATNGVSSAANLIDYFGSEANPVRRDLARNRMAAAVREANVICEELPTNITATKTGPVASLGPAGETRRGEPAFRNARKSQSQYDAAVVEVALYNYECFYGLKHGTTFFELVEATSAGIDGWAASVLEEEKQPEVPEEDQKDAMKETGKRRNKGEDEEARILQIALLESVGSRPIIPRPRDAHVANCESRDDASEYDYEEDSSSDSDYAWCDDEDDDTDNAASNVDVQGDLSEGTLIDGDAGGDDTAIRDNDAHDDHGKHTNNGQVSQIESCRPSARQEANGSCKLQGAVNLWGNSNAQLFSNDSTGSDDGSWSEVSAGADNVSDGLLVSEDESSRGGADGDWQHVNEGRHDSDCDWSKLSDDEM